MKSLPLAESALMDVRAPLALMIDGEDVRIVSSWKDCYQALCERLMAEYGDDAEKICAYRGKHAITIRPIQ